MRRNFKLSKFYNSRNKQLFKIRGYKFDFSPIHIEKIKRETKIPYLYFITEEINYYLKYAVRSSIPDLYI